jgi:prepilin-type N-terminal cleavage/methylation domain-containing protein
MKSKKNLHGFTLVEIIVVLSIAVAMMAGVLSFYIQNLKGLHAAEQRTKLTAQVKKLTAELIVHASRSNACVLYKTVAAADFDGPNTADIVSTPSTDRQSISPGGLHPAGDFVVFVYYQIPKTNPADAYYRITKLEGYFLDPDATTRIGKIRKVVVDLSAAPFLPADAAHAKTAVEDILTANWSSTFATHTTSGVVTTYSTFFTYARGLLKGEHQDNVATTTAPARLFYISNANSVIICGQLYGTGDKYVGITPDWRTFTQTFNFTITPRT